MLPVLRPDGTGRFGVLTGYRHCVPMGRLFWRPNGLPALRPDGTTVLAPHLIVCSLEFDSCGH